MKQLILFFLVSLSILGTSCHSQSKDVNTWTDAEIQQLKVTVESDDLWKEYISVVHGMSNAATSKNLYTKEELYKSLPNFEPLLAKAQSNEEAKQILLSVGFTEAYANLMIKWLKCTQDLQQKYPEITQIPQSKLNLTVPLPKTPLPRSK